jgi:hypothetical protein
MCRLPVGRPGNAGGEKYGEPIGGLGAAEFYGVPQQPDSLPRQPRRAIAHDNAFGELRRSLDIVALCRARKRVDRIVVTALRIELTRTRDFRREFMNVHRLLDPVRIRGYAFLIGLEQMCADRLHAWL